MALAQAPVPAPGSRPTNGYLKVRQPDGKGGWKIVRVHSSQLSASSLAKVLANGLNPSPVRPVPGGGDGINMGPATPGAVPAVPGAGTGVAPAPAAPDYSQFAGYKDPDYFTGLSDLRQQLGLVDRNGSLVSVADQARLAQLSQRIDPKTFKPMAPATMGTGPMAAKQFASMGGMTLYDLLYKQQQAADSRNVSLGRSDAARKGVMRSGYWDRMANDLAGQAAVAQDKLIREVGTDLTDSRSAAYQATQSQADKIQQYNQGSAGISQAAVTRGYQDALSRYRTTYGGY
jgi:hypothetical protein